MSTVRLKNSRRGTRGRSSGSCRMGSMPSVWEAGIGALDAPFTTIRFTPSMEVFWRMQEDEHVARSSRSILTGWRTQHTLSTWSNFPVTRPLIEVLDPSLVNFWLDLDAGGRS